jgi:hypothetical protein
MEVLIKKKIQDVTHEKENCHMKMRKLFPVDLTFPPELRLTAVNQIKEVMFAVHFNGGKHDKAHVERCKLTVNAKENQIANAFVVFPHGRAILASMIAKSDAETDKQGKLTEIIAGLDCIVAEFPGEPSTKEIADVAPKIKIFIEGYDSDMKTELRTTIELFQPASEKLSKAVQKYYKDTVAPILVSLEADMNFADGLHGVDMQTLRRLCDALPLFDDAHAKSGNTLLPQVLVNLRAISKDLKGLICDGHKCADAIDGEYFSVAIASPCLATSTLLHPDKFRAAFGDLIDWFDFIDKFRASTLIQKAKDLMTMDVRPMIEKLKLDIGGILGTTSSQVINMDQAIHKQLECCATADTVANIDGADAFAVKAGDITLRAQLGRLRSMITLVKAVTTAKTWQWAGEGTTDGYAFTEASLATMSSFRQAVRTACFSATGKWPEALMQLFTESNTDANHIINDFDSSKFGTDIQAFVTNAVALLDSLQEKWKNEIIIVSNLVWSWIPDWTPESVLEEEVSDRLLKNENFNALGDKSTKLFALLELHKKMID